jgi:hypothetical protein
MSSTACASCWTTRLALALGALLVAGCATRPPHPDTFSFGVMGDAPYSTGEEAAFVTMMQAMNHEPLAFVVHIGDLKAGSNSPCTDALFERRREQFNALAHPLAFVPGDNDWVDCRRASNGSMDPLERLDKLRRIFFADRWSLGLRRMLLVPQEECANRVESECRCPGLPENRTWAMEHVLFVTLNLHGSNNNIGFDAASDREAHCRDWADKVWLEKAFARAADASQALVIFVHANPWLRSKQGVYDAFLAQLAHGAAKHPRPVLLVHGDTHTYRVDRPLYDAAGKHVPNLTRLESFGSPFVRWVRVTVDANDPAYFRIDPGPPDF